VGCDGSPTAPGNVPVAVDVCNICGGNSSSCIGCDGIPFGKQSDACGVCGGDGTTCYSRCGYTGCDTCLAGEGCTWCDSEKLCFDTNIPDKRILNCTKFLTVCSANFFDNLTPLQKGLGGGAIAGIIIAVLVAILALTFGGKKGYDTYMKYKSDMAAVSDNPLYAPRVEADNPLYEI